ncbi:hypothetical protein [uncultured Clostridium sp.]|uniref:hypothetical protein n=1 Tax=uncultured Clostridium sp. TaxID=59620 RepID=UPI00263981BF|nr:hypothetical protein [uncultured Clostridium sp.]
MEENKVENKLKESFKREFNKKNLNKDFYKKLELKIEEEKIYEKTLKGKIKILLEREIQIDIRGVIAAAVFMIILPSIFSLKEINKEYRDKLVINNTLFINKEVEK